MTTNKPSYPKPRLKLPRPLNSRQHLVLINALSGMPQTKAYEAVYGSDTNSLNLAQRASNLFNNVYFKAELEKQQNKMLAEVQESVLSQPEKRQILADIARASLADHLDADGNVKLDRSKARALKEYYKRTHTDQNGNPISTSSIKLVDVISAIQEDNKMMGHYAPKKSLIASKVVIELMPYRRKKEEAPLIEETVREEEI